MDTTPLKLTISPPVQAEPATRLKDGEQFWGEDGFTFSDILDIVNPFQQIPVVSTLYRESTGEGISTAARLAGGALLGGPIGFMVALVNSIIEDTSGKDIGGHVMAMLNGENSGDTSIASENQVPSRVYARGSIEAYLKSQSLLG